MMLPSSCASTFGRSAATLISNNRCAAQHPRKATKINKLSQLQVRKTPCNAYTSSGVPSIRTSVTSLIRKQNLSSSLASVLSQEVAALTRRRSSSYLALSWCAPSTWRAHPRCHRRTLRAQSGRRLHLQPRYQLKSWRRISYRQSCSRAWRRRNPAWKSL